MKYHVIQLEPGLYMGPVKFLNNGRSMQFRHVENTKEAYHFWIKAAAINTLPEIKAVFPKAKIKQVTTNI